MSATQLVGGVMLKILEYFEVTSNIFEKTFSLSSFIVITVILSILSKKLIELFCLYCPCEKLLKIQVSRI